MRMALVLLLLATTLSADFLMEKTEVTVSDVQGDGSAKVHESIKFIIFGDYSNSLYDSSIATNNLSHWSTNTALKDVKMHVNTGKVDVRDFRLRPQPRTKCNPIQGTCHGELILDYWAYPSYNSTTADPLPDTGLFTVEKYKPRTKRYTINPRSLSFTNTPDGNIILEEEVYFKISMPSDSVILDVNPQPAGADIALPASIASLSWNDIVLVKFSLIFDVEDSIDKEVTDFFSGIMRGISDTLNSPHGFALVLLILILIGSYLYIIMARRRGEE